MSERDANGPDTPAPDEAPPVRAPRLTRKEFLWLLFFVGLTCALIAVAMTDGVWHDFFPSPETGP